MRQALLVWAAVLAAVWLLMTYIDAENGEKISQILQSGNYCTQSSLNTCVGKEYLIFTPDQPSLYQIAKSNDFSQYVHSNACKGGKRHSGRVQKKFYQFCLLVADPLTFTEEEKLDDALVISREAARR